MAKSRSDLISKMDAAAISLLGEAFPDNSSGRKPADPQGLESGQDGARPEAESIDLSEKTKTFEAVGRWIQIKHKIDPEEEKDALSGLRRELGSGFGGNSGAPKRRANRAAAEGHEGGADGANGTPAALSDAPGPT